MKTILLIGLGAFGKKLCEELYALNHEVMAIDCDEQKVNSVMNFSTAAKIGDSTNIEFLKSLGVDSFDLVFVTISNDFQSSLETTSLLKELGAKYVIARAEREIQEKFLLRNGADEVLYPEKQVAKWAAIRYPSDHIYDYNELDENNAIFEVDIPKAWLNQSIIDLDVRRKFGINIIGVKKSGKSNFNVSPELVLTEDYTLLVLGEYKKLYKCFHI